MLQQTQVATVLRYYEPFLQAFPDLATLAAADEQEVLRRWEGLGYYRRARNLHRAARQILALNGLTFPDDPAVLEGIPGFGRYTRGAVLSQAFDQRLPILEVNSLRVFCRLFGRLDAPDRSPTKGWLWKTAEALLPQKRVGDFNQALMELGALICTSGKPSCSLCPIAQDCVAHQLGLQESIPFRAPPKTPVPVKEVAVIVHKSQKVLIVQRSLGGRWPGLWEFPHGPLEPDETHEAAAERLLHKQTGILATVGSELRTIRHTIMHYRVTLVGLEARYRKGNLQLAFHPEGRWVYPEQLPSFPFSSPQRRLARALARHLQKQLF